MPLRIFNVLIGTWLFVSAFAWPHSSIQGVTALVCGALTAICALATIYVPRVRYLTALVGLVLFVSTVGRRCGPIARSGKRDYRHRDLRCRAVDRSPRASARRLRTS